MTEQTPGRKPSTTDQILDLLLDALVERQKARGAQVASSQAEPSPSLLPPASAGGGLSPTKERETAPSTLPASAGEAKISPSPQPTAPRNREQRGHPTTLAEAAQREPAPLPVIPPRPGEKGWQPPPRLPSIQMGRILARLAIAVALLAVLINIPIKSHGVSLARILPDSAALIIRDGLVLKGSGEDIYMLQDDRLRWISSMDAFEHLKLTWKDVHVVDDAFLEQFEMGHPIHLILKCNGSPHIYALENGKKRWIKDIDTFTAEGYVWDDVQLVTCPYLRNLADGVPIPEDAGPPPQP